MGFSILVALFLHFLQLTLPGLQNINTHSFRIGGASASLSAGALDALLIRALWGVGLVTVT